MKTFKTLMQSTPRTVGPRYFSVRTRMRLLGSRHFVMLDGTWHGLARIPSMPLNWLFCLRRFACSSRLSVRVGVPPPPPRCGTSLPEPWQKAGVFEDWQLDDPDGEPLETFRRVRTEIKDHVEA